MTKVKIHSFIILIFCVFTSYAQITSKKMRFDNASHYEKAFELLHTKLEVSFDIPEELLFGKAWVSVRPYFYATHQLELDAKGMLIEEVSLNNEALSYAYDGAKLLIDLGKTYSRQDSLTVHIAYTARPGKIKQKGSAAITSAKGLYFINAKELNKDKPVQIWTQGETEASSCWFPTIDSPNQKTTQELAIRVPDKFVTLSNGNLIRSKQHENGERTDYWEQFQKHAPYLFFMGIGEFSIVSDSWRGKKVDYYVEKEYEDLAKDIFGKTPAMLDFFSELTGIDYVWDKYSQIVVRDFVSGAMENTTAVAHGEHAYQSEGDLVDGNTWEYVIAHELFHHWFGNLVTAENWANISLNEAFANYSEYLWFEHAYGVEKAEAHRIASVAGYMDGSNNSKHLVRYDYENKEDVFDAVSYNKGGVVLHMLRNYLGDAAFFEGIQLYLKENMYSAAEVSQLRLAFESISGKDLKWFFEQWFYGAGHPVVRVSQDYNLLEKTVTVTLRQQGEVFYFPLEIKVYERGKITKQTIFVDAKEKSFTLSYEKYPDWIHVNSDHKVLGEFQENKTLKNYMFQFENAPHFEDRKLALKELVKHQENKDVFELVVSAFDDPFYEVQIMALDKIDLSYKHAKRKVISKIENIAYNEQNTLVKAAAIKVMGRLVYFDYQDFFEKSFAETSNAVKGAALEGLYYLDNDLALQKAKSLPDNVKGTIAYPLSLMYIKEKEVSEMAFVSNYIIQGMFLSKDEALKKVYKDGFEWIAKSNNVEAYKNLTSDIVKKGNQYRKYNFHLEGIQLLRKMAKEQDRLGNSNKKELIAIVNDALEKLIEAS